MTISQGTPEPYLNAPAADLDEAQEPVYVLVGQLVVLNVPDGGSPQKLRVEWDSLRDVDDSVVPTTLFFRTPRTESQAKEWLDWFEAPEGVLEAMVAERLLVRVDTSSPAAALASLANVQALPASVPAKDDSLQSGLMAVKRTESGPIVDIVTLQLAQILWTLPSRMDLPNAVASVSRTNQVPVDVTVHPVLEPLGRMLQDGNAYLLWTTQPPTKTLFPRV